MKNTFVPVFLAGLLAAATVHGFQSVQPVILPLIRAVTLVAFCAAVLCYRREKIKSAHGLAVLAVALLIGGQLVVETQEFQRRRALFSPPRGEYVTVRGVLADYPRVEDTHSMILLRARSLEHGGKRTTPDPDVDLNLRIKVKGNLTGYHRGDIVEIAAVLYPPRLSENFRPNPVENYFLVRRIHLGGYCKSHRLVTLIKPAPWPWRLLGQWRNRIRHVIQAHQGEENKDINRVFLGAILLGEKDALPDPWKERLLDAGVYHLLAISGAHIGIIALFCLWLLKRLSIPRTKRYLVTALVLMVFLALSGFSISAQRAVIMALLIFTARVLYADIHIFNIIALCGFLLLALNPAQFLDPGYLLTFTLTAAIVAGRQIFLPLLKRFLLFRKAYFIAEKKGEPPEGNDDDDDKDDEKDDEIDGALFNDVLVDDYSHKPPLPPGLTIFLAELLCAGFTAALVSVPLSLFFFSRCTFAGFFAGLLLVPLTGLITATAIILIPLAPLAPAAARAVAAVLDIPLGLFFQVARFFSDTVNVTLYRGPPPLWMMVVFLTVFFLLARVMAAKQTQPLKLRTWNRLRVMPPVLASILGTLLFLLLLLMTVNLWVYSPDHLEVFYLDVGQGDAQVVVFPGGDALLIDGGGNHFSDFSVGRSILLPFLLDKGIRIKWVAVSHFHPDHAYGVADILPVLQPEALWISSQTPEEEGYRRVMAALPPGTDLEKISAPTVKTIAGCTVEFLFPHHVLSAGRSHNDHSQVIKISDQRHSFLFTGDIGAPVEAQLADAACSALRADVIKVPHHGSASSSTVDFLRCVSPRLAVFSCGVDNRFGFPHPRVVNHYKTLGIRFLTTARSGGIRIVSAPGGPRLETSR